MNLYRPFYALGGPPYSWSTTERNLNTAKVTSKSIENVVKKAKEKVVEWAFFLCGIINEAEIPKKLPDLEETLPDGTKIK